MDKLIEKEMGGKVKITDKEIADFYEKNKAEFVKPETAHARHILVSKTQGDTDKILKEKKAKAEALRKKLQAGADFAELAAKNSDCPSKTSGGDLGTLGRDQTVKPFNDAIFSQPMKAIGPIVETQFGFHIIQVLDRRAAQTVKLDSAGVKSQIKDHLEALKKQGAVNAIVKRLRASANIEVYGS
jgi:peptidyl-prolyl cis-trans isomerase C